MDKKQQVKKFFRRTRIKKTILWRAISFGLSFIIAWLITGDMLVGGGIAIIGEPIKFVSYWLHEKYWGKYQKRRLKEIKREHGIQQRGIHKA